jgi:hypothetical protein
MPDPIPTELIESIADDLSAIRVRLVERNQIETVKLRLQYLSLIYTPERAAAILRVEFPAFSAFRQPE